ncbi:MAG: cyclic nucleotide-binding domain-containing protein, partial [Nitrospirae bacterium]|nr:cyclic nucleotide-binding domain-containing protein [Nitrospirota bacterium]
MMDKPANNIQPIGHYLKKKLSAEALDIDKALHIQAELAVQGIYKPLGCIVVEYFDIDISVLEECVLRLWEDILRRVPLFKCLLPEAISRLAAVSDNRILPAGHVVYRDSDKDETYYVIASGSVRIFRHSDDEADVTFAILDQGEGFGEIALLTDEPRCASVVTLERTSLLRIPRDAFIKAVFSNPAVAKTCAGILADRLSRDNLHIVEASSVELAYRNFILEHMKWGEPMLLGKSQAILKLQSHIADLAGNDRPVLITGEPGTEVLDVAAMIHKARSDSKGLLMVMDTQAAHLADRCGVNEDAASFIDQSQSATLFGRGYKSVSHAPERRLGLIAIAGSGMVVIENIEFLESEVQDSLADYIGSGKFKAVGESEMLVGAARIIATSHADLEALVREGRFSKRLYGLISVQSLTVPPLRERKKDIRQIVEELIRRNDIHMDKSIQGIEDEAYIAIMGYDWPGNVEELRVVIRRAASIAKGGRLMLEDIFIGPPPVTGKFTFDLLKLEPVRRFFKSGLYPSAAIFITTPFLALIIGAGLFGTQDPDRNVTLALTWGFWEPVLVMSSFFAARMWCSFCPVGGMSVRIRRLVGFNLKVPLFIRKHGFYMTAAGIVIIVWAQASSGMVRSPRSTAILVLCISALAATSGILFQRSTWCRYLCPLGGMVAVLSGCSIMELRSNYSVCKNDCLTHDCFAGDGQREGCPMFEGPFSLASNLNCIVCGVCVKNCPHRSPVLNIRLPGYDLWTVQSPDKKFVVLGTAIIGTQIFRGIEKLWHGGVVNYGAANAWLDALLLLAASLVLTVLYFKMAERFVFGMSPSVKDGKDGAKHKIVYVFLPLALAYEAGFHVENMLTLGGQLLHVLGRQLGLGFELPGVGVSLSSV